jgi:hypothetical protein
MSRDIQIQFLLHMDESRRGRLLEICVDGSETGSGFGSRSLRPCILTPCWEVKIPLPQTESPRDEGLDGVLRTLYPNHL